MTVVEYEDRIVLVDVGLRFPTAEMMGIDLVLPDFAYLRGRVSDIEAIVVTHGHEDHLGCLPLLLRELGVHDAPPVYGGPLTMAMARSKLDEHKLSREVHVEDVCRRRDHRMRAVRRRADPHDPLDPGRERRRAEDRPGHDAHHRRLQVRPDTGRRRARPTSSRLAELGRDGLLLLCGDSTNGDRPGFAPSETVAGPNLLDVFSRCKGRIVVTSLRVEHPPRPAGRRRRVGARPQGRRSSGRSMRKNTNIGRTLGHIKMPDGHRHRPARDRRTIPTTSS